MALVDRSGTIVAGGTAQSLLLANVTRNGFSVQNLSIGDLWVNEVGGVAAAAQPSIKVAAGATYQTPLGSPCPAAASIFGATTAQAFTCREW
jgi:hypothetical protein